MKQIIFIFMAILLATGMASAQNKAVISADETSHDFGTIKEANGNVSHTFKIKNTGEAPLVLTRVIASWRLYDAGMDKRTDRSGKNRRHQNHLQPERPSRSFCQDYFRIQQW